MCTEHPVLFLQQGVCTEHPLLFLPVLHSGCQLRWQVESGVSLTACLLERERECVCVCMCVYMCVCTHASVSTHSWVENSVYRLSKLNSIANCYFCYTSGDSVQLLHFWRLCAIYIPISSVSLTDIDSTCSEFEHGTALHIAASNLAHEAIKVLVQNGANTGLKDDLSRIPLGE